MKNIAIIGIGHWGINLARNFYNMDVLRGVFDINRDTIKKVLSKFQGIIGYNNEQDILEDKEISAVVIATNAPSHYDITKKILLAGKDVFVEKPMALKVCEGEELVRIAKEKEKILFIGHLMEYHPAVVKLTDLIRKGELGRIQYIYSNRLNLGKVRQEENILFSFAPHDIAIILRLLNEEPEIVYAAGASYLRPDIADVTVTHLKFKSGVHAHIFVSWLHPYKDQHLVVIGDKCMAVFNDVAKQNKLTLYQHKFKWIDRIPVADPSEAVPIAIDETEPLKIECEAFIKSIETRQKPLTDGESALKILKILEECEKFLKANEKIIPTTKEKLKFKLEDVFIHNTAVIDENVSIGEGTKIWHFAHVMKNTKIGKKCVLSQNVFIGEGVEIGNNVKLENVVNVFKGVKIMDNAFLAPSVTFTNVKNPRAFIERKHEFLNTIIDFGATIGASSVIVCGSRIGKYAFIGAGSVVTKDVKDFELVYGNPAKHKGWVCRCGKKLEINDRRSNRSGTRQCATTIVCKFCNDAYILDNETLRMEKDEDLSKFQRN